MWRRQFAAAILSGQTSSYRESAAHHDKFLHDALGMPIAVWDREDGKLHSLAYED